MKIVEPGYEILDVLDGMGVLRAIEYTGRVCYKSEDKITDDSAVEFARMLIRRGHLTPIEQSFFRVRFVCDRGVSHELVRHRLASFNQESTRYVDYEKGGEVMVIEPPGLNDASRPIWRQAMLDAEAAYLHLRKSGQKPEIARSVLPNSLKTEIIVGANMREWRHIFKLRAAKPAHPQMRQLMCPLLAEMRERVPVVFDDVGDPGAL